MVSLNDGSNKGTVVNRGKGERAFKLFLHMRETGLEVKEMT